MLLEYDNDGAEVKGQKEQSCKFTRHQNEARRQH
jgi:hypothetical protein